MKDLIIIGAGGCGREILQIAKDVNKAEFTYNLKGFLDDGVQSLNGLCGEVDVIGTIADYIPQPNDVFACSIFNPQTRRRITQDMLARGARFVTLIHPTATPSEYTTLGQGCIIYSFAGVSCNVTVGDFCILENTGVGHDTTIGAYSSICQNTSVGGHTTIGEGVMIGSNVCIIPGRTIGDGAQVGAGSVVIRNVKPHTKVFGNPAKVVDL